MLLQYFLPIEDADPLAALTAAFTLEIIPAACAANAINKGTFWGKPTFAVDAAPFAVSTVASLTLNAILVVLL